MVVSALIAKHIQDEKCNSDEWQKFSRCPCCGMNVQIEVDSLLGAVYQICSNCHWQSRIYWTRRDEK